ncbi:hypothetical protein ACWD4G_25905 [Streptomyces sp. NPDC002643]
MNGSDGSRPGHGGSGRLGDGEGRDTPPSGAETESDMGERHDTGAGNAPRTTSTPTSAAPLLGSQTVDALLANAVRGRPEAGGEGEARALAAFRTAREQGVRSARTRRRDDWRPNPRRRVQLSFRTTLAVALSSLTLGGAAFAAIGTASHHDDGGGHGYGYDRGERDGRTGSSDGDPYGPGTTEDRGARGRPGDRPGRNPDPEADCRADRTEDTQKKNEERKNGTSCDGESGQDRTKTPGEAATETPEKPEQPSEATEAPQDKARRPDGNGGTAGTAEPEKQSGQSDQNSQNDQAGQSDQGEQKARK